MLEMNEKLRFSSDLEKVVHNIISKISYGGQIQIELEKDCKDHRKTMVKAIRKSASFNCIEINIRWSKSFDQVMITHRM